MILSCKRLKQLVRPRQTLVWHRTLDITAGSRAAQPRPAEALGPPAWEIQISRTVNGINISSPITCVWAAREFCSSLSVLKTEVVVLWVWLFTFWSFCQFSFCTNYKSQIFISIYIARFLSFSGKSSDVSGVDRITMSPYLLSPYYATNGATLPGSLVRIFFAALLEQIMCFRVQVQFLLFRARWCCKCKMER